MLVNLLEPVLDVIESLLVSAVIDEDDAHSSFVIGLRNGSEALLTCSVPHLQLNFLVIYVYLLYLEVNPYITDKM